MMPVTPLALRRLEQRRTPTGSLCRMAVFRILIVKGDHHKPGLTVPEDQRVSFFTRPQQQCVSC